MHRNDPIILLHKQQMPRPPRQLRSGYCYHITTPKYENAEFKNRSQVSKS